MIMVIPQIRENQIKKITDAETRVPASFHMNCF
jgi:hypothetical protein